MKTIIIAGVVVLLGFSTAYAGAKLVRGEEFAQIGMSSEGITVYKVIDGNTTCYVSRQGKFGVHAISCVK